MMCIISFVGCVENLVHLFLGCPLAKYIWTVTKCTFALPSTPSSIENMFGEWLGRFNRKQRNFAMVGIAAVIWSIWKARNVACFRHQLPHHPSSVVFAVCQWLDFWSVRESGEGAERIRSIAAGAFSCSHGWAIEVRAD